MEQTVTAVAVVTTAVAVPGTPDKGVSGAVGPNPLGGDPSHGVNRRETTPASWNPLHTCCACEYQDLPIVPREGVVLHEGVGLHGGLLK